MGNQADVVLTGDQGFKQVRIHAKHDDFTFDFSDATLHTNGHSVPKNSFPFMIHPNGHDDIVVRGGTVIRHQDLDTPWRLSYKPNGKDYVHNSGFHIYKGDGSVTVDGLRVHNTHDGIVIASRVSDEKYVNIRHVYATHIRDDVVENDGFKEVVVEDSLFDGVFVGFSAVGGNGKPGNADPTFTVRDTFIRMENMAGDPTGKTTADGWGHGRLFKWWHKNSPDIVLENNIFVLEDKDGWDESVNNNIIHSKNNVLIWMGKGKFTADLPSGFKLIEGDDSLYWRAHDAWLVRHGYDPDGSLAKNLHAPDLDGPVSPPKPKPDPEPDPEPENGLVASWDLDANLNGKGQKVVLKHDASLELDEGSVVIDFTASKVAGEQTLLSKDSNGFDDGGHLTIRLVNGQVIARLQSAKASYELSSARKAVDVGDAHQVAVSFGDDGFRLFLDGKEVDRSNYKGGIGNNKEPLVVGANAWKSSDGGADHLYEFFKGSIAEVAIYDQQLDADAGIFLA
jgi:hypothetical protein